MPKTKNTYKKKSDRDKKEEARIKSVAKVKSWRERNPMKYAYNNLKSNAKRRGIPFDLSFEHFKEVAIKYKYIAGKGITKYAYHIDKIKDELGYVDGNIRVMRNTDNVKKYHGTMTSYYCPYEEKMIHLTQMTKDIEIEDDPFA